MRTRRRYQPRVNPGAGLSTKEATVLIAWLERMAEAVWLHHRDGIHATNDFLRADTPHDNTVAHPQTPSDSDGPLWTDDVIPF